MHTILAKLLESDQVSLKDLSTELRGEDTWPNIIQFCFIKLDAAVWGKNKDPNLTLDQVRSILKKLLNLLSVHQVEFTQSNYIATILHRLGYLVQLDKRFPALIKPYESTLVQLIIALSTTKPNTQEIANSYFGLGQLKDSEALTQEQWQPTDIQKALLSLLAFLQSDKPTAQGIANTFYGLSKLAISWSIENRNIIDRILPLLLKQLLTLEDAWAQGHIPKPIETATTIYALGYLSEQGVLLVTEWKSPERQEILLNLYQKCQTKKFTAIGIAQIFYGFGKLAEDGYFAPDQKPPQLMQINAPLLSYIDNLPNQFDLSARVVNTVFFGLGRLARAKYLIPAVWKEANQKLKSLIPLKPFTDLRDSANLLRALGRLAEYNCLQPKIWSSDPNILSNLLNNIIIDSSTSTEDISTLFYSIGKLLDEECIPTTILPEQQQILKKLIDCFLKVQPSANEQARFFSGFTKMSASKYFNKISFEPTIEIPSNIDITSSVSPITITPWLQLHYDQTQQQEGESSNNTATSSIKKTF